jgi:nucleotide-binding universal stress UspA family protein
VAGNLTEEAGLRETSFEWPRYPRILVAIDETPAAVFALRHVVPYAVDQRSHLTLLSVVPNPPASVAIAGVAPKQLADQMENEFATRLRGIAASLPQDLSVATLVRHGDPAEEILALLAEQPFDMLCLGARGRGRITGALLGSVSTAVLHHSPVPVLVLHPPPHAGTDDYAEVPRNRTRLIGQVGPAPGGGIRPGRAPRLASALGAWMPWLRISRLTRSRPIRTPSRPSAFQGAP